MTKTLITSLTLLTIAIIACKGQATQTPLIPATSTATMTQPVQPTPIQNTPTPSPIVTFTVTPTAGIQNETPLATVSFTNDVLPIFVTSCNKCHGVEQTKEGLDLRTYAGLLKGSFNGAVITPGNADDSFLVQQLIDGEMPKRGAKLASAQIQIIIDWINTGALNN